MLGVPEKHLEFHIWYLKEKRWIERNENGGFVITANGVDDRIYKIFSPIRISEFF
jgi:curved DNA-binding protein